MSLAEDIKEVAQLTIVIAFVGWATRSAFGKSLTPNPSQSGEAFFTFLAAMVGATAASRWFLKELKRT